MATPPKVNQSTVNQSKSDRSQINSNKVGQFIVLEGTEGVGKTTNLKFIEDIIRDQNLELIVTREPGGTPLAEELREILLAPRNEKVVENAELLLMFAARAQHFDSKIMPALSSGKWVLCDRFTDATYAYQGGGRGVDKSKIELLENLVQGRVRPDHIIILDVDVEIGLKRAGQRGDLDRFEQENRSFFENVREAYLERATKEPHRYHLINAAQPLKQVQAELLETIKSIIG